MSVLKDLFSPSQPTPPPPKRAGELEENARTRISLFRQRLDNQSDRRQQDSGLRL